MLDELNVVDVHAAARTALLVLLPTEAVKQRGSHLPLLVDIVARRDAAVRLSLRRRGLSRADASALRTDPG